MNSEKSNKSNSFIFDKSLFIYDFVKWTGFIPTLIALRPKAYYISEKAKKKLMGKCLIMANHECYIDPINIHVAIWYRRLHILATQELFSTPKSERFFTMMQCIPVNKKNFNFSTFTKVKYWLGRNSAVMIFPEGTVNGQTDSLNTFHSGIVLMALQGDAPIVPVYMRRRAHWYSRLRYMIGEPINIRDCIDGIPKIDDFNRLADLLRKKEFELKDTLEERIKKKGR